MFERVSMRAVDRWVCGQVPRLKRLTGARMLRAVAAQLLPAMVRCLVQVPRAARPCRM
jgi:hypothetical protein